MPDSFSGYKTQRFRWAYGAVQILKRHWRDLSEGQNLTRGQRYHFISGWLPWFADAAHIGFTAAAIVWSGAMGPNMVQLEIQILTSKEGQSAIRTAANAISPFIGQANAATRLAP